MKVLLAADGRRLHHLAATFAAKGHSVVAVAREPSDCARLARRAPVTVVHGDASDPSVLEEAGARVASVVLAATGSDADNLITCQMARLRFRVPRAVALVNDPENEEVFRSLGVEAFSTGRTVASLVEQRAAFDAVTELVPAGEGAVRIAEVTLDESSPAAGRRVAECGLPPDALIAVVTRDGESLVPRGPTELRVGDRVLLVALESSSARAVATLTRRRE